LANNQKAQCKRGPLSTRRKLWPRRLSPL